jgi:hypothetical protein
LQSTEQLKKREWKGDINCTLCGTVEDVDHIMFRCVLSRYVWSKLREIFGWSNYPRSREDFVCHWIGEGSSKANKIILFGFGVVCWSLWKVRNKMAIEKQIVKSPKIIFFNIIIVMQQWIILLPAQERDMVAAIAEKIKKNVVA